MSSHVTVPLAVCFATLLAACTTPSSDTLYSRNEARTAWTVVEGRVSDIKPMQIEGNKSVLGTAGGGYVGYELGRTVGSGRGRDLAYPGQYDSPLLFLEDPQGGGVLLDTTAVANAVDHSINHWPSSVPARSRVAVVASTRLSGLRNDAIGPVRFVPTTSGWAWWPRASSRNSLGPASSTSGASSSRAMRSPVPCPPATQPHG